MRYFRAPRPFSAHHQPLTRQWQKNGTRLLHCETWVRATLVPPALGGNMVQARHLQVPNPRVGGCLCRPTKGAGRARPVNRGGGGWGEVAEYCKIFHPLGGKIAGFFPLCAKFPSLRPPPRPCCSNWIPSRLKKP